MAQSFILLVLLYYIIFCAFSKCQTNVSLEILTRPGVFGQNFKMQCNIRTVDKTCPYLRQWYGGGRDYPLLCQDGICRNGHKYTEKVKRTCSYMLTIHNLSVADLNCIYGCHYGFQFARKELKMDEAMFRYYPTANDTYFHITNTEDGSLKCTLNITKAFPRPKCQASFTETYQIPVSQAAKKHGVFYQMSLNVTISRKSLMGDNLKVVCLIGGKHVTLVNKNLWEYNSDVQVHPIDFKIVMAPLAIIVLIIIGVAIWTFRRKKKLHPIDFKIVMAPLAIIVLIIIGVAKWTFRRKKKCPTTPNQNREEQCEVISIPSELMSAAENDEKGRRITNMDVEEHNDSKYDTNLMFYKAPMEKKPFLGQTMIIPSKSAAVERDAIATIKLECYKH